MVELDYTTYIISTVFSIVGALVVAFIIAFKKKNENMGEATLTGKLEIKHITSGLGGLEARVNKHDERISAFCSDLKLLLFRIDWLEKHAVTNGEDDRKRGRS